MFSNTRYLLINTVTVILLLLMINATGLVNNLNNLLYDLFLQFSVSNNSTNKIVIVKIDDESVEKYGGWPLNRALYSRFLDIIFADGAKIAGVYLSFDYSSDKLNDDKLISTLNKYNIVLLKEDMFSLKSSKNDFKKKIEKVSELGHSVFRIDKDGIVRNYSPVINDILSFSFLILKYVDNKNFNYDNESNRLLLSGLVYENINNFKVPINFKTPWYRFKQYSIKDIFENNYNKSDFKDSIVLLGLTKEGLTEYFSTPLSKTTTISGGIAPVSVQAQIIDSFLNYDVLKIIPPIVVLVFILLYIPFIIYIQKNIGVVKQFISGVFLLSMMQCLIIFGIFKYFNIWIPPILLLFSNFLVFVSIQSTTNINISSLIDNYIKEFSVNLDKNDIPIQEDSVDGKLISLQKITSLIEEDRHLLDVVLSSVRSIIVLYDESGNIVYTNSDKDPKIKEELLNDIDFIHIKDELETNDIYKKIIVIGNRHYECIANKAGKDLYTGVFNEITDIINMNEMKSSIMRMFTHEIKTPLTTILLSCDFINSVNKVESLNKYIEKISSQTELIRDVIINYLDLNKIESKEMTIEKENIDLVRLISLVINDLELIAESKNIAIKFDKPLDDYLYISGSKKYLYVMIKNLVDNALKYSPDYKNIFIRVNKENDNIIIAIKDQGFGIPEDHKHRLFDKFYRIKSEKTENISGTGLGLSFVKKIVELHGGTISVESKLNEGTEFNICLPALGL